MKIVSKTLLLFVATATFALNVLCNDSSGASGSGGTPKPAEYSPASAYISVWKSVDEQAIMAAMTRSYALLAKRERVLRRSVNNDVDDNEKRRDRIKHCKYFTADKDGIIKNLQRDLRVTAVPGTNLISVSMTSGQPAERAVIVNAVADAIVTEAGLMHAGVIRKRMQHFTARLSDLANKKAARQKEIKQIQGDSEVPIMTDRRTIMHDSLGALATELMSLRLQKARTEADFDAFKKKQKTGDLANSPEIRYAIANDPSVAELRAAILEVKITALGDKDNEQLAVIQKKLEAMLAARQKDAAGEVIELKASRLKAEVASIRERLLEVGEQYNEQSTRLRELGASLQRIAGHQSTIDRIEQQISQVEAELLRQSMLRVESPLAVTAYAEAG